MQQKVTVTFYLEVGHTSNMPDRQAVLQKFARELPDLLDDSSLRPWSIDSITVEK